MAPRLVAPRITQHGGGWVEPSSHLCPHPLSLSLTPTVVSRLAASKRLSHELRYLPCVTSKSCTMLPAAPCCQRHHAASGTISAQPSVSLPSLPFLSLSLSLAPCPSLLFYSPLSPPIPLPHPSSPSLFPIPLPHPSSPSLFPIPLPHPPHPSSPSLFPIPLPHPSSPSLFPIPLPHPSSPSLFPIPLPHPSSSSPDPTAVSRLTASNRLPHLLLYGPPGTGKTSTVLAVARQLYGAGGVRNMCLELNASDERGIDVVRQQVQDFASTQSISFGAKAAVKLVVLDEADAMTKDAQFSLRRVIEKYTRSTRFCLICNHVSKIIPALQSRCTRFRFAPLSSADVTARLRHVIQEEGLDVTDGALSAIVSLSAGDMRRALNILQSAHMSCPNTMTEEAVYASTGNPMPKDIQQMAHWLLNEPFRTALQRIQRVKEVKGLALIDIVRYLHGFILTVDMPAAVRIDLFDAMADIEYRLTFATSEKAQLGALVGAFTHARSKLVEGAK
ncbi:unnamed protein product [Closterium sp. Yama58-4]|nr:unnamed protein product [Closterium sp. Yama58-4]